MSSVHHPFFVKVIIMDFIKFQMQSHDLIRLTEHEEGKIQNYFGAIQRRESDLSIFIRATIEETRH